MRWLVVGVNSLIGKNVSESLRAQRAEVLGTSRTHGVPLLDSFFFELGKTACSVFDDQRFDVALIAASVTSLAACKNDIEGSRRVNVDATKELIDYLISRGTFLIYLSSSTVLGGQAPQLLPNAPFNPLNEYATQKVEVEKWLQSKSAPHAIIRFSKVVASSSPPFLGWKEQLRRNSPLYAFTDISFSPILLATCSELIVRIGEKRAAGVWHCSARGDLTYFEAAQYFTRSLGHDPEKAVIPTSVWNTVENPEEISRFSSLNCSRTTNDLGWDPPEPLSVISELITRLV